MKCTQLHLSALLLVINRIFIKDINEIIIVSIYVIIIIQKHLLVIFNVKQFHSYGEQYRGLYL